MWVVVAVLLAAAGWWYFASDKADSSSNPLVRTALATTGDLVVSVTATGRIDPIEQVDVKSKASGEIVELPIEVGDSVHNGDLIARLDRRTAQNDYDQAKADQGVAEVTLEQRQKELNRQQGLFDRGLTAESVLDDARLAYEQANSQLVRTRAALLTTQERLEDTEIRAPIDGIVLTRPVERGQIISSGTTTVTGGTLLCTIANMNQVHVIADVDETDIGKVEPGMTASIAADAFPDSKLEGNVERVAPLAKVEQNVTMFEVTVLVNNHDGLLKAGMNATVEVIMARADDVLLVPARAVEMRPLEGAASGDRPHDTSGAHRRTDSQSGGRPAGQSTWAAGQRPRGRLAPFVQVRRNGQDSYQRVRTGLSNLDDVEITEGLAEGDTVVYSLTSGAMASREAFRDRMRSRNAVPGMRSQ
jgi:HlyD family secretion protein